MGHMIINHEFLTSEPGKAVFPLPVTVGSATVYLYDDFSISGDKEKFLQQFREAKLHLSHEAGWVIAWLVAKSIVQEAVNASKNP